MQAREVLGGLQWHAAAHLQAWEALLPDGAFTRSPGRDFAMP
jgi:hypothetical protein